MSKILAALTLAAALIVSASPAQAYGLGKSDALLVGKTAYQAATQNGDSRCHVTDTRGNSVAPAVPSSVRADVRADEVHGYKRYLSGVTGNGFPTVQHRNYRYSKRITHAWVAGYQGRSCDVWTKIGYTS